MLIHTQAHILASLEPLSYWHDSMTPLTNGTAHHNKTNHKHTGFMWAKRNINA